MISRAKYVTDIQQILCMEDSGPHRPSVLFLFTLQLSLPVLSNYILFRLILNQPNLGVHGYIDRRSLHHRYKITIKATDN